MPSRCRRTRRDEALVLRNAPATEREFRALCTALGVTLAFRFVCAALILVLAFGFVLFPALKLKLAFALCTALELMPEFGFMPRCQSEPPRPSQRADHFAAD